jgi:uncharacterized membrane-anchored protein YhcB (DUF1043 family)
MTLDLVSLISGLVMAIIPQVVTTVLRNNSEKQQIILKTKLEIEKEQKSMFSKKQFSVLHKLSSKVRNIINICGSRDYENLIQHINKKLTKLEALSTKNSVYLTDELNKLVQEFLECSEPARFSQDDTNLNKLIVIENSIKEEIEEIYRGKGTA